METDGIACLGGDALLQYCHPAFISQNLDRLCQVQRSVFWIGRDVDQGIALLDNLIGQTIPFTAKDQCLWWGVAIQSTCKLPGCQDLRGELPQACRYSSGMDASSQCFIDGTYNLCICQHIKGTAGKCLGIWMSKDIIEPWTDKDQPAESHCLECPGGSADIAWVAGFYQDKP